MGFLMTALPRMTGTPGANPIEYFVSALLLVGQTVFAWQVDPRFFYGNQILLILFLILYGGRRLIKTSKPLPIFFSHVGIAMFLALIGSYCYFSGNSMMGIHLYHVGTTLLLVLGLGTRFFSFLSGLPSLFESVTSKWARLMFHASGVGIGYLLYLAGQGIKMAYLGLTLISLIYLFKIWQIQRPSSRPSALKLGVRIVALMIPASFFLIWLQPMMFITWLHLLFIGCFGMITFAVATRVTLAHGSYPIDFEMKSQALWWMVGFLVFGIVSRVLYGFSGGLWKVSYLHLAATFWILAVGCWCWSFLPKIFKPGPQAKPSC